MIVRICQLFSACVLVFGLSGCISLDLTDIMNPVLEEHEISQEGAASGDKILIIDISGLIRSGDDRDLFARYTTPDRMKAILNKAAEDDRIKAVVLRINSPGGEVTATDIIHHDLVTFKKASGIPVFAAVMDLGTSGAYYVAAAADQIYSHPTSILGSLGVIARVPQYGELADKIGYSEVIFKSGENKDLGNPLKEMNAEQRNIFQGMIDSMYERFLDVVAQNRAGLGSREDLREIADGRIYTPDEAMELELIDGIAYLDDVIAELRESAGLAGAKVITYDDRSHADSNIYSRLPTQINLLNISLRNVLGENQAGFHYLWMPTDGG